MGCFVEFFRVLFKTAADLIGWLLCLGGLGVFFYGIFMILATQDAGAGFLMVGGAIVVITIGTILRKTARGDYDGRPL